MRNTFGHIWNTFGTHVEHSCNTVGTHLEHSWTHWNTFGTHGTHLGTCGLGHFWENLWETTESAKPFLSAFAVRGRHLKENTCGRQLRAARHFLSTFAVWETGLPAAGKLMSMTWGNRLPTTGGTARPGNFNAFLIRNSKNPFRQAWLGY